jgi:hypothetical protein
MALIAISKAYEWEVVLLNDFFHRIVERFFLADGEEAVWQEGFRVR